MSIVAKIYQFMVYERIITQANSGENDKNQTLSQSQMGSRRGKDRFSLLYVMLGTIRARAMENKETYIAQADVESAYPSASKEVTDHEMWTHHNIRHKIWRVMRSLEKGERGTIRLNGRCTYEETHEDGFSQGGVHAGHRFLYSIEPLFRALKETKKGATVTCPDGNTITLPAMGYVDDVIMMADSSKELQTLLNTSEDTAHEKNFSWSPDKTNFMVANPRQNRRVKHTWYHAGKEQISYTNEMLVLGEKVSMNAHRCKNQVQDTLNKAKAAARTLEWLGAYEEGMPPHLVEILFNALVQSVLTSGLSVSSLTKTEWEQVDSIKANIARRYLQVGERANPWAVLDELGWGKTRAPILKNKIRTLIKIIKGSAGNDGQKIATTRIKHAEKNGDTRGPIVDAWHWTQKITGGISEAEIEAIKGTEIKSTLNKWVREWEHKNKEIARQKERERREEAHETPLANRRVTKEYKCAPYIKEGGNKYKTSLKATFRMACANLTGNKTRKQKATHCRLCQKETQEDETRILAQCSYLESTRQAAMWEKAPLAITDLAELAKYSKYAARALTKKLLEAMASAKPNKEEILLDHLVKEYLSQVDSYMLLITGTSLLAEAWTRPQKEQMERDRDESWDEVVDLAEQMQEIIY